MIKEVDNKKPIIDESCFIAENASVVGEAVLGKNVNVWYGTVIRSEMNTVDIGDNTNIQDNSVVHNDHEYAVSIGNNVTIGHGCIIHGCKVEDNVLIGMGSIVLNGAHIGKNTIIGAGSLVTQHKEIPSGVLCMGSPAKVIRELTKEEIQSIQDSADEYVKMGKVHKGDK